MAPRSRPHGVEVDGRGSQIAREVVGANQEIWTLAKALSSKVVDLTVQCTVKTRGRRFVGTE